MNRNDSFSRGTGPSSGSKPRSPATRNRRASPSSRLNTSRAAPSSTPRNPLDKLNRSVSATPQSNDHLEDEFDIAYSEYLRSLVEKQILSTTLKKQHQHIEDQLATKQDNLEAMKQKVATKLAERKNIKKLQEYNNYLDELKIIVDDFKAVADVDVQEHIDALELCSTGVRMKNIAPVKKDDFKELMKSVEKCSESVKNLTESDHDLNGVENIKTSLELLSLEKNKLDAYQSVVDAMRKDAIHALLKHMSDQLARNE